MTMLLLTHMDLWVAAAALLFIGVAHMQSSLEPLFADTSVKQAGSAP
ncbi:hypothetical protein [Cribrihabitans neustonicus]